MYTASIGSWAYWIIGIAAFTTMFSTTLTVLDAYPRVLSPLALHYAHGSLDHNNANKNLYWIFIIVMAVGTIIFIEYLTNSMRLMVDLATTISFITAPVLAYLNYRVVTDKHMPPGAVPGKWLRIYAWTGIIFLGAFTLFYIGWRLFA
jgi:Mn2+/Fe2+ NRAMP family transporter